MSIVWYGILFTLLGWAVIWIRRIRWEKLWEKGVDSQNL